MRYSGKMTITNAPHFRFQKKSRPGAHLSSQAWTEFRTRIFGSSNSDGDRRHYFETPGEEWPEDYIQQLPYSFQEVYQTNVDDTRNRFDRINKIYNPGAESKTRFLIKMFRI